MGLDVTLEKQNVRYDFDFSFMKVLQPQHFSKEDVIKIKKIQIDDDLNSYKDSTISFKSIHGEINTFNYRKFLKILFKYWIESFDEKDRTKQIILAHAQRDGKEEFMTKLIEWAFPKIDVCYVSISRDEHPHTYKWFDGDLWGTLNLDDIPDTILTHHNYETGISRVDNKTLINFMKERFAGNNLTDKEIAFIYLMKDYKFYQSNDPWVYPLFFLHQQKEMFEKYKPEFLDTKIDQYEDDKKTLREILDSMIKHKLEWVAG